jgi:hypothetical protein
MVVSRCLWKRDWRDFPAELEAANRKVDLQSELAMVKSLAVAAVAALLGGQPAAGLSGAGARALRDRAAGF